MVRKLLSTEENKKKYCLALNPPAECGVYAVDGYIINEGCRCDKLVLIAPRKDSEAEGEIFVELKGKDVAHAIAQLEATLSYPLFSRLPRSRRCARIVAQSYPRNTGNSLMERAKLRFLQRYGCDLRTRHSGEREVW